jgi:hypothetical protein
MTLAGWDEKASKTVAADPATHHEVLEYLITPKNVRPALLPALMENPAVKEEQLAEIARSGSRDVVEALLVSERVKKSPTLKDALGANHWLRPNEVQLLAEPAQPTTTVEAAEPAEATENADVPIAGAEETPPSADEAALVEAIEHYLKENAAELAAEPNRPFQAIGGLHEESATVQPEPQASPAPKAAPAAPAAKAKRPAHGHDEKRDSTLQKIAKLDVKGRINLAVRGSKEERSILIRDGTKLVALAVLDSPKVTDGEVEGFAQQKNVLEAVLRAIPMKRRFAKNYVVTRNLVFNPRTPLDLSLGLMKNMLVHDLKNLSGNKEISETIRKLALRMYKQKIEKKG